MARTKYTVTFPAAKAGDEVTWPNTVKVYPDADGGRPLVNGYVEASGGSFVGWSDSASVTFTRRGKDGTTDPVTVTSGSPTGTGAAAPTNAASSAVAMIFGVTLTDADTADGVDNYPPLTVLSDNGGTDITWDSGTPNVINVTAGIYKVNCWWTYADSTATGPFQWAIFLDDWYDDTGNDWTIYDQTVNVGAGTVHDSVSRIAVLNSNRALAINPRAQGASLTSVKMGLEVVRLGDLPNP